MDLSVSIFEGQVALGERPPLLNTPSLEQVVQSHILVSICSFQGLAALCLGESHLHQVLHFVVHGDLFGVVRGPLSSLLVELLDVVLEHLCDHGVLRVI